MGARRPSNTLHSSRAGTAVGWPYTHALTQTVLTQTALAGIVFSLIQFVGNIISLSLIITFLPSPGHRRPEFDF
jgi:hypothetical protein